MDEVFGEDNFRNEIVWHYTNKMSGSTKPHDFVCEHDTIFRYSKSENYLYYTISEERDEPVMQSKRVKIDGKNMRARDEDGNIIYELSTEKKIKDVWTIPYIASTDSQRVDYATQKPEALLERIIKASSDKGMTVADFFGGSGVTAAVANRLGRKFIHTDININSIQTTRDRLLAAKAEFDMLEIKDGVSLYRNPIQTMERLKSLIVGLRNEDALDEFWEGSIIDSKYGMTPVYLPNLMDSTTRMLDKPLMNEIIHKAIPDLPDETKRVIIYYIDIDDPEEIQRFIKEHGNPLIEIELRDLKQVLDNVVAEDYAEWNIQEARDGLFNAWKVEIIQFQSDRVRRKIEEINQKNQLQVLQQKAKGKEKTFSPIIISDEGLETIEWISLDCTSAEKDAPWQSDSEIKIDKSGYVIRNGVKTTEYWDACIISEHKPLRMKIRNICGDETVFVI